MSSERRLIRRKVGEISPYDLDGSLSSAAALLVSLSKKHGAGVEVDWGNHDPYTESKSFGLFISEPESDEVFAKRQRQESEARQNQVAYLKQQAAAMGFELKEKS